MDILEKTTRTYCIIADNISVKEGNFYNLIICTECGYCCNKEEENEQ